MAYEYVNIRTDTIDNVKVPTKETLDARTIIESTLEPAAGADDKLYVYNIGLWQFPKTGFYKIKLAKVGALGVLLKLYARITKDDGTTPDDWDNDNLKAMGNASGDGLIEEIYAQVDYINDDKFTVYRVQFFNCFGYLGSFWVNTYDKTTQKWAYDYKHRVTADHVSNDLTLTKGDVTTKFNGSVAREVSIPTKTSELTNDSFVSYAEQTLTEGQQNQAKTNLGIDVLTGNTTTVTPTQVKEAILAGRPVVITYTDTTYGNMTFTSFGYSLENNVVVANLVSTYNTRYILGDLVGMSNNDQWTLQTTELGTSTDIANNYVKYSESQTLTDEQKAQARNNIGANFEPFKVTLSRTYGKPYLDKTPKEIYDAYTAGKYVYLKENSLLPLTFAENSGDGKYTISFSGTSKVSENYNIQVTSFSVINVTPDYSEQWTENYKYNIDAKVFKLNYNPSTNEVSGSNPYNSIAALNYSGSDQTAVIQLNINNANNKLYLNQIATVNNNTFIFQVFGNGNEILTLIIASNSMQIQTSPIINENNVKNIVDQSYVAFYTEQALSDKEKKQARDNIGAISSSELVQSDWNQNDTSSPAYIQNRPGGYYSVVNSVNSGTLTTTDFIDLSSEGPGITGYGVQNETLNTALQNLNVTAGKTYKISWVDNDQAFSYISEAVDQVKTEGSVTYHNICIFGDTIVNLTAAELIWGKTAKVILLNGNSVATATNTVTNIKIEEVNVVKIPKALVESDNIEEFDLSNNYTATNKGSIKYNYIGTSTNAKETIYSALLGFKNNGSLPQLELFGSMMDTNYTNTTQYLPAGIYSSWVNHSETGDTFIQGMTISHDPNNKLLKLESKLIDNITEDLTVRGIATPTADNDAVNKKYVDDSHVQSDWNQNETTAKDYVKNRPGAYFSGETIEITQSLENLTWHTQDTLKIAQIQRTDIPDELYENIPYEICWGNEKHYIKLTSIDDQLKFGDTNNEGMPVFTNYPFFIHLVPSNSLDIILPNTSTPPSSISIKFNQGLVKLSEGYIDQIPGKISLYNISSNICSVDTLEIGVIEDNKFYGVENNQIGYLPTSNGVSGGLALFSPIPPFNQARMTWLGANSLSQFLGNSKSFSGDFGNNEQENVRYNQALSEIHRYSYTLDHCRATIGFASTDYYSFKLYCDTTTSTKAIPTAIGYTVKNNKVYQLKVTANNLSTNGQVDFVFTEFLDLDTIASKSDIPIIDTALSSTSENPVQNNVINTALKDKLQYKGNWQSNTTYNKNDVVYDETNLMYVYTETDATSDPPDINPNCQPLVNIATNVKKGTLGVPNASTIYSQFNYLIDASTTDSGKYLTVNSEGNPEWGTITAPEESVVIAKLTGAGTTASPYACDKTYNELYTAILAGKYVLMYDNTTKRMLSPYFINIQARLLQFQHVLYEQTGSTTTTSKLTVITVNYNGGSNTLTRTVYSSNIVSSVNGKTENVITLSASDVGAASSEDLNTLKNSIPEISVVTLDD